MLNCCCPSSLLESGSSFFTSKPISSSPWACCSSIASELALGLDSNSCWMLCWSSMKISKGWLPRGTAKSQVWARINIDARILPFTLSHKPGSTLQHGKLDRSQTAMHVAVDVYMLSCENVHQRQRHFTETVTLVILSLGHDTL